MKKNKTSIILSSLLVLAIIFATHSKFQENKLRVELDKLKSEELFLKDSVIEKNLPNIDSLLIKGDYENALTGYEEQLEFLPDNHKELVKFRIDIANEFINLKKKENQKRPNYFAQRIIPTYAQQEPQNNGSESKYTAVQNPSLKKINREDIQFDKQYLTFKSSKKHNLHYVGAVSDGKANGYGVAVFDTGGRYEGEWVNNLRQGKGAFYWTDGQYYHGDYKNDLREGTGTYFWPNGEKYIGQWKKDKRHGEGIFYNKKGKTVKGVWKKDKLIEEFDKTPKK